MGRKTITNQLVDARQVFSNIDRYPELQPLLNAVGYTTEVIDQGRTLLAHAEASLTTTHGEHAEQLTATEQVAAARARLEDEVGALTQTVRALYGDDLPVLERLGLRLGQRATPEVALPETPIAEGAARPRRRSRTQGALIQRSYVLYDGIASDPTIAAALEQAGYSAAQLAEGRALLQQLESLEALQEGSKAEAMTATGKQHSALDALNAWMTTFSGVVRARYRDDAETLRKLGLR